MLDYTRRSRATHAYGRQQQEGSTPRPQSYVMRSSVKERYEEKLSLLGGKDPYEIPAEAWKDDVELWPSTTYIHVGLYLLFSPSPYTSEDLLNYKSLECYQRFTAGWVREIFVSAEGEHRLLTAKVNCIYMHCDLFSC